MVIFSYPVAGASIRFEIGGPVGARTPLARETFLGEMFYYPLLASIPFLFPVYIVAGTAEPQRVVS